MQAEAIRFSALYGSFRFDQSETNLEISSIVVSSLISSCPQSVSLVLVSLS